jgi:hypothetical protein
MTGIAGCMSHLSIGINHLLRNLMRVCTDMSEVARFMKRLCTGMNQDLRRMEHLG